MRKHIKKGHFTLLLPTAVVIAVVLTLWDPFSFSMSAPIPSPDEPSQTRTLKYYGYYFTEDPAKNQAYVHEVKDFANVINMRYDNGANNSWDYTAASRVKNAGVKVMLQLPLGPDSSQTLFVDRNVRRDYLNKVKQDMLKTDFMSSLAYIAPSEEWYVLISQGYYDTWPIFQGKTKEEKFAIAKQYLEQIIDDIHDIFPGIPTVIVENILPYPAPPSNVDVLGIDAYYIPDHEYCSGDQLEKFNREVLPYFDAAKPYNKPIMMVPPSFIGGPWKMLSQCQMEWYVDLATSGKYNIESLVWFFYADTSGFIGVRNFPGLVQYQKSVSCQILGTCSGTPTPTPTATPTPTPSPSPSAPVIYKINLQANNGQYVVAEKNGGELVNANRNAAGAWETFKMTDLNGGQLVSGDKVGISTDLAYYFRAVGGGGSTLDATARTLGSSETFTILKSDGGVINNGDKINLGTSNGANYVVGEGGGGQEVAANRTWAWAWETFTIKVLAQATPTPTPAPTSTPTPTPTQPVTYRINLQANNGQYVVAEGDGGGAINANRDWAQGWETFTLTDINGGKLVNGDKVGIKTGSGYYFRAEGGGGSTMDATAGGLGPWETFDIGRSGGGNISNGDKIYLGTWNSQHFVVAENGGGDVVKANRTAVGAWEMFTVTIR